MRGLAIDTSNLVMGVATIDDGRITGEYITNLKKNHSVRLMPAVEQLMQEVDMSPKDLDRVIVATGPGSYTGVRIGVSIAKTLAWSLEIPIVGVSSLEVLAQNGAYFNGLVSPLFDARRGQVYTGLYQFEGDKSTVVGDERLILMEDWLQMLKEKKQPVLFLGNDVELYEEMIREQLGEMATIGSVSMHNPRASELARLGMAKEPENLHTFVPNYLRLAEAEAKWLASQGK